ncbi:MAG: DUF3306 domain-containing protein [Hyphomicrobiales bacterium]
MTEDEKFVSRWARRKAESRTGVLEEDEAQAADAPVPEGAEAPEAEEDPDDHPAAGIDVETLDYQSDFTVFMHEKVPEALRRRALRQLWLSNPILANVDGLNDYDEDFTDSATVVEGLKAAYDEARRRMASEEAEAAKGGEAAPVAADEDTSQDEDVVAEAETETQDPPADTDDDLDDGTDEA